MQPYVTDYPIQEMLNAYRITVAVLAVVKREGKPDGVVLVQPAKGTGMEWILPQGEVHEGETYFQALQRELEEELPGIEVSVPHPYLGARKNPLPADRGAEKDKYIYVFGAQVSNVPTEVDGIENTNVYVAYHPTDLYHSLCANRSRKRDMILRAVSKAHKSGLLAWSCDALSGVNTVPAEQHAMPV